MLKATVFVVGQMSTHVNVSVCSVELSGELERSVITSIDSSSQSYLVKSRTLQPLLKSMR